jgi:hypothetical protein
LVGSVTPDCQRSKALDIPVEIAQPIGLHLAGDHTVEQMAGQRGLCGGTPNAIVPPGHAMLTDAVTMVTPCARSTFVSTGCCTSGEPVDGFIFDLLRYQRQPLVMGVAEIGMISAID